MLNIYFNKQISEKNNTSGYEFVFISHLLNPLNFKQDRYKEVISNGSKYVSYSSKEDADYHIMPYKWKYDHPFNNMVIDEAIKNNKSLIIPFIDDSQPNIDIENSIILKANIDFDKKRVNEICIPIYPSTTFFNFKPLNKDKITIGFCGQSDKPMLRKDVCEQLKKSWNTNFIYRDKFHWFYDERSLNLMRIEYSNNLQNNLFNLSIRGVGNFSYRLCEIMHFGRIPIIIKTNNCLPLENIIEWNKYAIICEENELSLLNDKINYFIENNDLLEIQIKNRKIWEEFLSPLGYTKNLSNIITAI